MRMQDAKTVIVESDDATRWIEVRPFPGSDTMCTVQVRVRWRGQGGAFVGSSQSFDTERQARDRANDLWRFFRIPAADRAAYVAQQRAALAEAAS